MPYLIINQDNSIQDIVLDEVSGGVFIADVSVVSRNEYGHTVFDYVGNKLVLNEVRYRSIKEAKEKERLIRELIDIEKAVVVRNLIASKISNINAMSLSELRAAKENFNLSNGVLK